MTVLRFRDPDARNRRPAAAARRVTRAGESAVRSVAQLVEGGVRLLRELPAEVPHTFFMSSLHATVCARMADLTAWPAETRRVYTNLLFGASQCARQVTALIELVRRDRLRVRRVVSDFIGDEFQDLLGRGVSLELREPRRQRLVDIRHFLRFAGKTLGHRAFRQLSRRRQSAATVVRGWVDTTDQVYPDLPADALLLIYPFAGSMRRQYRYLQRCRRQRRPRRFAGVPYRFRDALRMLLPFQQSDRLLVASEAEAFRRHSRELAEMGVQRLYTTDEFSAAGCVFHEELANRGVWTMNCAHGAALYGPHVRYAHHRFLNPRQCAHYRTRGGIDDWDYTPLPPLLPAADRDATNTAVVFVCGNWRRAGKRYESAFEERCVAHSARVCRELGLTLYVRGHPNAGAGRLARLCRRHGVPTISAEQLAALAHPVFVNTVSSYYYDCLGRGPTVFLGDELLDPQELFGDGVQAVVLDGLADELAALREPAEWRRRTHAQLETERRIRAAAELQRAVG